MGKRNKTFLIGIGLFILLFDLGLNIYLNRNVKKEIIEEEKAIEEFINEKEEEVPKITQENPIFKEKQKKTINYTFVIEIPKIGLKKGFYSMDSKYNKIKYGIEIIEGSSLPNVENGNFILASHEGTSSISYFDKLRKLSIGDSIYIYYEGMKYEYQLNNYYEIEKNGTAVVHRDSSRTTITLVTCKHSTKNKQLVFIGYQVNAQKY